MDNEREQLIQQVSRLKENLDALAHENAGLRVERDIAWAKVHSLLPQATPEQEAEMRAIMATGIPDGLAIVIRELEASKV